MNIFDIASIRDICNAASTLADGAIALNNEEVSLSTLAYMSDFMYSMSKVLPAALTLVEWRDLFDDTAYDHITVERQDEQRYVAIFHMEFNKDIAEYYNIASVLDRKAYGSSYDEARLNVVLMLTDWVEVLKDKTPPKRLLRDKRAKANWNVPDTKWDTSEDIGNAKANSESDIDEGFVNAPCPGDCEHCDHEDD